MMQPMLFSWLYFTLVSLQSPVKNFSPGIPQTSDLVGTYSFWPLCRCKVFPQQEYDVLSSLHYTTQHCLQPADSSCWCLNCISCSEGTTQDPTFLFICVVEVVAKPSAPPFAVHLGNNNYDLAEGSPEVTWSLPCFNRCLNFW